MTKVKQSYKGPGKTVNVKTNFQNYKLSVKVPRNSEIKIVKPKQQPVKVATNLPVNKVKKA